MWAIVITYAVLVFLSVVFPNWLQPASAMSAIWALILGTLSLFAALLLGLCAADSADGVGQDSRAPTLRWAVTGPLLIVWSVRLGVELL